MDIHKLMSKAITAVEFMYDKLAEIKRYEEYTKANGADGMHWVTKHTDVPCRLSSARLANTSQGEANVVEYDVKLFLSPSFEIKAGDKVLVDGVEFDSAKEPFVYVSHQELLLKRMRYA